MRYAHLWIIAAASATAIGLGATARAEQDARGDASCKEPSCDEGEIAAACGMDIECGAKCKVLSGDPCHELCEAQDVMSICEGLCPNADGCDPNDMSCNNRDCVKACEQEFSGGCPGFCSAQGAVFCDHTYVPLLLGQGEDACYAELCEAKMLNGKACKP